MKVWRTIPLGPFSIHFRLARRVRVSSNRRRRLIQTDKGWVGTARTEQVSGKGESALQVERDVGVAIVIGVGPGLGYALARRLSGAGMRVALASRNAGKLDSLAAELNQCDGYVHAYDCDATNEKSVQELMRLVVRDLGVPDLVVYSLQEFPVRQVIETEVAAFEEAWRGNCLGAFIVSRESARLMVSARQRHHRFMRSHFGRNRQSGIRRPGSGKIRLPCPVSGDGPGVMVKGRACRPSRYRCGITEDPAPRPNALRTMYPNDLSDLIYLLHQQPRSAWTPELDARPWDEAFWEHC